MSVAEHAPSPSPTRAGTWLRVAIGLLLAVGFVVAAWMVSEQAGFETIGQGGNNQRLLPKMGEVARDFETWDVFGNPVRLSDSRGRPVWRMFWGS